MQNFKLWSLFIICFILKACNCDDCDNQIVSVEFTYINETDYDVKFYNVLKGNYSVKSKDTVVIVDKIEQGEDNSCDRLIVNNIVGITGNGNAIYYSFSDIKCDTLSGSEDPSDPDRYECTQLGENKYRLTYRYRPVDFERAKDCP